MPLPTPNSNQKESDFVSSCMKSEIMRKEYPDQKQRAAVCFSQYKRRKQAKGSDPDWGDCEQENTLNLI